MVVETIAYSNMGLKVCSKTVNEPSPNPTTPPTSNSKVRSTELSLGVHSTQPLSNSAAESNMQNEDGVAVDLYIPRRCSWTNRLIESKDHAAVQINIANVDPVTGISTGENTTFCLAGFIRFKSEGDMALTELVRKNDMEMMADQ